MCLTQLYTIASVFVYICMRLKAIQHAVSTRVYISVCNKQLITQCIYCIHVRLVVVTMAMTCMFHIWTDQTRSRGYRVTVHQ